MIALARNPVVQAWLVMVALTTLSWWLGAEHGVTAVAVASVLVLVAAFTKVVLIGTTFMELRHAAPALRVAFFGLTAAMGATLLGIYLAG